MRILLLLAIVSMSFTGCAHTDEAASVESTEEATMVNKMCPMNPVDEADPEVTRTYAGKTVGFCCPSCQKKWDGMAETAKQAALAAVSK